MKNTFTKIISIALFLVAGSVQAEATKPEQMVLLVSVNSTSLKNPVLLKSLSDSCLYTGVVERRNADAGEGVPGGWSIAISRKVCDQIESPVVLRATLQTTAVGLQYQAGDKVLVASQI